MIVEIIILVVCIATTIYTICVAINTKSFWLGFIGVIPTIIGIVGFLVGLHLNNVKMPTAMDVYKGKTTLEITYRDSIPIDSIVVFKE